MTWEATMTNSSRSAVLQWITPPIIVPALIAIAVLASWLMH
jgi:hypothetical protein